ncbi:DNA-binding protein [Microbacterium sp. STN6]|uniref:DNA-binding protein n=1 Tax=Microbacterium sp. STN6 TaxID=2995588 RepID=UPI002260994E|nr:DNA-binding protein [Microbacterium sp. STN6]MCX7521343.1 DNA-binding protein [Microbacterium sp. STN6]
MFVVTADQVNSRNRPDAVAPTLSMLNDEFGSQLALPADRNAGDELQAVSGDAASALSIVLSLTRTDEWSVGLGCGPVRTPLPENARAASGPAFFAARDAVVRAKRAQTRVALAAQSESGDDHSVSALAQETEALLNLLLALRSRRSDAGWELYDLMVTGMPQNEAARRLGISAPAANARARVAGLKIEAAAIPALTRLLADVDRATRRGESA